MREPAKITRSRNREAERIKKLIASTKCPVSGCRESKKPGTDVCPTHMRAWNDVVQRWSGSK